MNYLVLLIAFLILVLEVRTQGDEAHLKQRNKEGDPEYHNSRKEWLEKIHRSDPSINYKLLRQEFMRTRLKLTNEARKLKSNSPELMKFVSDNQKIVGTWKERGSNNQSGRIHTADVDLTDNLIYAASAGGNVWRGTLNGEDWTCLNNSLQFDIRNIKVEHINSSRRIFVFDRNNLYYSDNEGHTWEGAKGLEEIQKWGEINRGQVMNNPDRIHIYILADEWDYDAWIAIKALYYSNDNGESFQRVISLSSTNQIDICGWEKSRGEYQDDVASGGLGNNYHKLYLIHRDTLFSVDGLERKIVSIQSQIIHNNPNNLRISGCKHQSDIALYIHAGNYNQAKTTVYSFRGTNNHIEYISDSPTNYFMSNSFGVSKLNPDIAILGGVNGYITYDGALTWNLINSWETYYTDPVNNLHADIPGIKSFRTSKDSEFFLISTDGGIYKTKEDYSVVNISLKDLNVSQYYSISSYQNDDQSYILAGSQDQGFQRSELVTDKVLDFEQIISGDYGSLTSGDGTNSLWTMYPGFATYYPDIINNTKSSSWNLPNNYNDRVWIAPIIAVPGEPHKAYVAPGGRISGQCKIWTLEYDSFSGNISAHELPYQFDSSDPDNDVTALSVSSLNKNNVYAATRTGKFYTSTDGGLSWSEAIDFIAPEYNYLHGTCIFPSRLKAETVYIAGSGYSNPALFVSNDNGRTFDSIPGLPPLIIFQIDMSADEEVIFAATSLGPYIYVKNHARWYDIRGLDAPDQFYWSVNYIPSKNIARFATYGRGIWDFEIEKLVTSVSEIESHNHNLIEVYPNPVSDNFNIKTYLPAGEYISLRIFDTEGRVIHTCYDGILDQDYKVFQLNTADLKIQSSATYLVILSGTSFQKYVKLNFVK
ncbi:MAG: T9SS type A sorting domain-containing protein [Candidatus Kapaibacterium sp.]